MSSGEGNNGGLRAFIFLVTAAVVAGLILFAIEVPFTHSSSSSTPLSKSPGARTSKPSPSNLQSQSSGPSPPDSTAPVSAVHILSPVNQPGFTFLWHRRFTISLAGVTFNRTGYQEGIGNSYNLQYNLASSLPGWSYFDGVFEYWQPGTIPGPANCLGQNNVTEGVPPSTTAAVGARYYFYNYDPSPIVVYMQVTQVQSSSVTVDAWAWLQVSGSN